MPKCIINDQEVEFKQGQNIIEVARTVGIDIPYFCYHPGLSVVAQCRMCHVEIEKMPKLQTACSTAAQEGMKIYTNTPKVKESQKSTMEFLLLNHPLDCPICDKSGECDLQDHSYDYGSSHQRHVEDRRTYLDTNMGDVIQKNMNRCIHCTRCIRFGDEVAKIREMVALQRGSHTEITTIDGLPLATEYAGNYADICPTGSLTLKDFRFHKRVWFLKKTKTVCEGCSKGCAIELHHENNIIYRCIASENLAINRYWICDEGRSNFKNYQASDRICVPMEKKGTQWVALDWDLVFHNLYLGVLHLLEQNKCVVLLGSDLTNEELEAAIIFFKRLQPNIRFFHFGTPSVLTVEHDQSVDHLLKRTSRTSNLNGCTVFGLQPFKTLPQDVSSVICVRGGRAVIPELKNVHLYGIGVFKKQEVENFDFILPSTGFAEKTGTIINHNGIKQKLNQVIEPPGTAKQLAEIFMTLNNKHFQRSV
jgi:NADH-quinone oxidoreductase subunit G